MIKLLQTWLSGWNASDSAATMEALQSDGRERGASTAGVAARMSPDDALAGRSLPRQSKDSVNIGFWGTRTADKTQLLRYINGESMILGNTSPMGTKKNEKLTHPELSQAQVHLYKKKPDTYLVDMQDIKFMDASHHAVYMQRNEVFGNQICSHNCTSEKKYMKEQIRDYKIDLDVICLDNGDVTKNGVNAVLHNLMENRPTFVAIGGLHVVTEHHLDGAAEQDPELERIFDQNHQNVYVAARNSEKFRKFLATSLDSLVSKDPNADYFIQCRDFMNKVCSHTRPDLVGLFDKVKPYYIIEDDIIALLPEGKTKEFLKQNALTALKRDMEQKVQELETQKKAGYVPVYPVPDFCIDDRRYFRFEHYPENPSVEEFDIRLYSVKQHLKKFGVKESIYDEYEMQQQNKPPIDPYVREMQEKVFQKRRESQRRLFETGSFGRRRPAQPTATPQPRPAQPTAAPQPRPAQPTATPQPRPAQPTAAPQPRPAQPTAAPQPKPAQPTLRHSVSAERVTGSKRAEISADKERSLPFNEAEVKRLKNLVLKQELHRYDALKQELQNLQRDRKLLRLLELYRRSHPYRPERALKIIIRVALGLDAQQMQRLELLTDSSRSKYINYASAALAKASASCKNTFYEKYRQFKIKEKWIRETQAKLPEKTTEIRLENTEKMEGEGLQKRGYETKKLLLPTSALKSSWTSSANFAVRAQEKTKMAALAVKRIIRDQIAEVRYRNEIRNSTKLEQRMELSETKVSKEYRQARDRYQKKVLEIAFKQKHKRSDAHLETKLRSVIKKNMTTQDFSLLKINLRPWELRKLKNDLLRLMDIKQRQFYLKKHAFKHPMHHAYRIDKGKLLGILRKRVIGAKTPYACMQAGKAYLKSRDSLRHCFVRDQRKNTSLQNQAQKMRQKEAALEM